MGLATGPMRKKMQQPLHAANELAKGMKNKTISPFIGIRIKPFTEDLKNRGVRTLDIF